MDTPQIFESEYRFCEILWEREPVSSRELVALCAERLGWKKSTTYTVIKRLSQRGIVKSEKSVVTSLVSRETVQIAKSEEIIQKGFGGSFPSFFAAFTRRTKLSPKEIEEIRKIIDELED